MTKSDPTILGFNHMFLYPDSMVNGQVHTETLAQLCHNPNVAAVDCWVWPDRAKEELSILRESGKHINYNIGDRLGETPALPAAKDKKERAYALDFLRRESEFAVSCGAKKIILGSGRDVVDHEDGLKRFVDLMNEWFTYIPEDICVAIEPVDWDIDKKALLGPAEETCACIRELRQGRKRVGILLDMGHIPIMHETLDSAVEKMNDLLCHIHLGSCIMKNKNNPLYGDKHPCWGEPDGEYDEKDGARFLQILTDAGYFSRGYAQTVSFEMRPLIGMDAEQTVHYLSQWFKGDRR